MDTDSNYFRFVTGGVRGVPGPPGPQGPQGPAGSGEGEGTPGADGLSAYELAVLDGFVGTIEEWLASLEGPQGPVGPQGDPGADGGDGTDGVDGDPGLSAYEQAVMLGFVGTEEEWIESVQGVPGPAGPQGPQGSVGAQGVQGVAGAQGVQGPAGAAGTDGNTILHGNGAPAAGLGINGNYYIDDVAHSIYGPKVAGAWGAATSLIGPQGAQGPQGNVGAQGPQGVAGAAGAQGPQGNIGPQGPSGVVNATSPLVYNSGTQTVSIDSAALASIIQGTQAISVLVTSGSAAVANNVLPPGVRVNFPFQAESLYLRGGDAPTGSALTLRINKNGSVWQSVTIAAGATSGSFTAFSDALVAGDILTFDFTAVGSTTAGGKIALDIVSV